MMIKIIVIRAKPSCKRIFSNLMYVLFAQLVPWEQTERVCTYTLPAIQTDERTRFSILNAYKFDTSKNIKAAFKYCYALHVIVWTIFSHDKRLALQRANSKNGDKPSEDDPWLPVGRGKKKK